jgi:uncharacterized protein YndB with AHSA1/START domain
MTEPLVVRRETQIAAPPATVFAYLTDPEKILSWMGAEAETETHPGGLYLIKSVGGRRDRVARGAFREVVPVHRLAYSFGWEQDEEVPQCANHAKGWAHYLGRLAMAAAGRNPGVDTDTAMPPDA